jgi:hypothetical protein
MSGILKPFTTITDFVTGRPAPNIGAEENRQAVERYLVDRKGYDRKNIEVDVPIEMTIAGEIFRSRVDLVVTLGGHRLLAIRCVAGSLVSYEREILAAAGCWTATKSPGRSLRTAQTPWCWKPPPDAESGRGLRQSPGKGR